MRYRGLTWDHPRGYNALAAAQGPINWDKQPLEGFESAPIGELCSRYDLVVLDHPHLGEALAEDCLRPLDEVLPAEALAAIAAGAIGPAHSSYTMAGRQWALPLDAATQVLAWRPDLVDSPPTSWAEVEAESRKGGVALSLAGPHAALSLLSVTAALDDGLDLRDGGWPSETLVEQAVEILAPLAARTPDATRSLNPIGLLDLMSTTDDLRMVPLVYGYVPYTRAPRPVRFADAPRAGGRPGSILGGTGIALSRRAEVTPELVEHLLWLLSEPVQRGFIPDHDGQPGLRSAWADPRVNAAWGDFYTATAATLEAAAIRPRHNGYIAFQSRASAHLREAFTQGTPAPRLARDLRAMFDDSLHARSPA